MESNSTPRTLGSSVSFEILLTLTRDENHVANEDTEGTENQEQVMGQVQDSVAAGRERRNSQKPAWLTTNMTVAYTLLVIEDAIPSTYKDVEISSESEMWKEAMLEEMNSLHKNDTWELSELPKRKKADCLQVGVCKEASISKWS